MSLEELGHFGLTRASCRDGDGQVVQRSVRGIDLNSIEVQKEQRGHSPSAFVAVDEGMILHNVVQIGSCHLEGKGMQRLTTKSRLRLGNGGLQKPRIAQTGIASIAASLVQVSDEDILQRQKVDHFHLLRQSLQVVAELLIDLFERRLQLTLSAFIPNRRNEDLISISRQFQRRIRSDLEQLQDGLVDHERQAVAVFDECFVQGTISLCVHIVYTACEARATGKRGASTTGFVL